MSQFFWNDEFSLGLGIMDETHKEFIELYNTIRSCDDSAFPAVFNALVTHTENHFNNENKLMDESDFPSVSEHKAEHRRVLNELKYFESKIKENKYSFARFYIKDRIPAWFKLHLTTMDSALAAHLNTRDTAPSKSQP